VKLKLRNVFLSILVNVCPIKVIYQAATFSVIQGHKIFVDSLTSLNYTEGDNGTDMATL
jgi:hypothetical protein